MWTREPKQQHRERTLVHAGEPSTLLWYDQWDGRWRMVHHLPVDLTEAEFDAWLVSDTDAEIPRPTAEDLAWVRA